MSLFARLLEKMRDTPEGDGTLLDHSLFHVRRRHGRRRPPHAARSARSCSPAARTASLKGGRHVKYRMNTPFMNLCVTVLAKVDVSVEKIGRQHRPADAISETELQPFDVRDVRIDDARRCQARLWPLMRRCWPPRWLQPRLRHGARRRRAHGRLRGRARAAAPKAADVNAAGGRRHDAAALGGAARRRRDGGAAGAGGRQRPQAPIATACSRWRSPPSTATPQVVKLLLRAGADPNTASGRRRDSAMTAARAGKVDALKALVAHGANAQRRDARGQTALMWAAARNNAAAVRALVEAGADLKVRTNNPPTGGGRGNERVHQPAADRLHGAAVRGPRRQPRCGHAPCSMPAPTSTTRSPTARARWSSRPPTRTGRWRASCSTAAPIRTPPAPDGTRCTRPCTAAVRTLATRRARCRRARSTASTSSRS